MTGKNQRIDFGDWLPDLPDNENPGALLAKNCLPLIKSYGEINDLSSFSDALTGACLGNIWVRASDETLHNFAGDANSLYKLSGGTTWTDVSQYATAYSAGFWDFIQFNDRVIATDGGGTDLQYYDIGTSSEFADLPGSPPRFKALAVVRDFIVGGNWSYGGDTEPGGLAWSGFNNSALWTPSLATQCDIRPTRGVGGQVQRIVPGERGIVFRENAILTMDYVGPPTVFKVSEAIVNHGTPAPRSVCWTRHYAFYYTAEGFMQLNLQTLEIIPIGAGRVNDWFVGNSASDDLVNITSTVDRKKGIVFWAFRSSSSSTNYDRLLAYNYISKRWAYAEVTLSWLGEFSSGGADLDTLDTLLGAGGIDVNSIPVDTDAYIGGALSLMGFNSSNQACTFDGAALTALIDTTEIYIPGGRSYVSGVRPIVEGQPTNVEVAPITRSKITDNPVVGSFTAMNDLGVVDLRSDTRYRRFRIKITGGFNNAMRIEFDMRKRGRR